MRKVQVRLSPVGGGDTHFGSGYLLAPRLVLTAAHILGEEENHPLPGEVTVCRPDAGARQFPATVCWYLQAGQVDAALLEVDRAADWPVPASLREQELARQPPQRWGELIGTHKLPIDAAGFPYMQRADDGVRANEQLTGHIQPGTGGDVHRYEIFSSDPTLPRYRPGGSRWSGMSGAAVVRSDPPYRDVLCGVVCEDLRSTGGSRLTVTPAYVLLAHPDFRALVTQHSGWEPVLEPADAAHLLTPAVPVRDLRSPAMLLRADVEAVRFAGRDRLLGQLLAWCERPEAFAVQVLTGPAGQGKTRLARHLRAQLRNGTWATGQLRTPSTDSVEPPDLSGLDTNRDLLLVVDYAENVPYLVRHLIEHLHSARHRTRILLLARADGPWREHSLGAGYPTHDILASAPLIELGPLHPLQTPPGSRSVAPAGRSEAFAQASTDLAQLLGHVVPGVDWPESASVRPPDDLHAPHYGSVLTLQMTALVSLLQHGPDPVEALAGEPPEATLLRHEARYWEQSAKSRGFRLGLPPATLHRAVATAVLCGAATKKEAVRAARKIPGVPARKALTVAGWLRCLYPAEPGRYWGSLQPDRVAEFHASRCLNRLEVPLAKLLTRASAGQQAQTVTVLARAALGHYNAHRSSESDSVLRGLYDALATVPLRTDALDGITAALPHPSRILTGLALRLEEDLTNRRRATAPPSGQPDLARSLPDLGMYLWEAGQREDALASADEAVQLYRHLAGTSRAAHGPNLARALSNLGTFLWEAVRLEEALRSADEAVQLYRHLPRASRTLHESELATALSNLGIYLSGAGQPTEALTMEEQAVKIRRRLARANQAAYEPDLAQSLSNLGIHLSKTGSPAQALRVTEKSVEICRLLARVNPDAYEPDLARALSNLATRLSEVKRPREALSAAGQSVKIRERLVEMAPAVYEPDLAHSLSSLGMHLAELERFPEAAEATTQAVDICRHMTQEGSAVHAPDLARALHMWAWVRWLGQQDTPQALQATGEAVQLYSRHAAAMPARVIPELCAVLDLQADLLLGSGKLREAKEIRRWLAEDAAAFHTRK
ncbi:tetratricopeptide repeat protein [Streptomyces violens]|uniref:tetratricopeptide repeat protein n=1 Tax=Streptomyces violens TaxID=66377 RepID=UPI001FDFCCCB|nr:tetratricopeptide repeat protein [Streptomyces violens]